MGDALSKLRESFEKISDKLIFQCVSASVCIGREKNGIFLKEKTPKNLSSDDFDTITLDCIQLLISGCNSYSKYHSFLRFE